MPKLKNIQRILPQDFKPEDSDLIDGLGGTLNDFMQDVIDLSDGRIDFDNLVFKKIQFDVQVDSTGSPLQKLQLKTGVIQPEGFQVIRAVNLTNTLISATSQPFIASYGSQGNDVVTINKVTGLTSGDKYRLTVLVF